MTSWRTAAADLGVLSSERRNIPAMDPGDVLGEARMERQWTGNARRLSHADRTEIERLIWGGETFEAAAGGRLLDEVDPAVFWRLPAG
jgi:hypothetical protein